jgi:hypothetical protein
VLTAEPGAAAQTVPGGWRLQAFGGGSGSYGLGSVLLGIAQLATASANAARRVMSTIGGE